MATHDIEHALYGTALGMDREGRAIAGGHRHHMDAINAVRAAGSIAAAVEAGLIKNGIMYSAVKAGIPYVLAGSIRDDGPLPEVITDVLAAQDPCAATRSRPRSWSCWPRCCTPSPPAT